MIHTKDIYEYAEYAVIRWRPAGHDLWQLCKRMLMEITYESRQKLTFVCVNWREKYSDKLYKLYI